MSDAAKKAKRKAWMADYIAKQIAVLDQIDAEKFDAALQLIENRRLSGGRIFVIGNGGSAANASHFAQDLGKGASDHLQELGASDRFRIQSLTDNVSWITALSNDSCYSEIFVEQLRVHASPGDIVIAISVSGHSANIVKALEYTCDNGIESITLFGALEEGDGISVYADVLVKFDDDHFGRVEDAMMTFLHMLCYFYMETAENI